MRHGFGKDLVGELEFAGPLSASRARALDSKIVINDSDGEIFKAEWTGPEIVANQRGNTPINVGNQALFMTDIVFSGIIVLGMSLGGALIYRILKTRA